MKTLILYYSRTDTTKKLAGILAAKLNADYEEVIDTVDRSGALGYLSAGRDATLRRLTEIKPLEHNPAFYDLVIIGTPIWSWNLSTPIRTLAEQYKASIKNAALFCTMGGSGDVRAQADLEKILGKKVMANLSCLTKEVYAGVDEAKIDEFVNKLK